MDDKYPALRLLLDTERLYPDERLELVLALGRLARLEQVNTAAEALCAAAPKAVGV